MSKFEIDINQLDKEWVRQPSLIESQLHDAADKRMELDQAKNNLAIVEAQLDSEVRADPDGFGMSKITEGAVAKTIVLQDEYQTALTTVHDAKYVYDVSMASVQALDHKKKGLEDLVKLHGQNYFSTPQAEPEELEEATKESVRRKAVRKKRKKETSD